MNLVAEECHGSPFAWSDQLEGYYIRHWDRERGTYPMHISEASSEFTELSAYRWALDYYMERIAPANGLRGRDKRCEGLGCVSRAEVIPESSLGNLCLY